MRTTCFLRVWIFLVDLARRPMALVVLLLLLLLLRRWKTKRGAAAATCAGALLELFKLYLGETRPFTAFFRKLRKYLRIMCLSKI